MLEKQKKQIEDEKLKELENFVQEQDQSKKKGLQEIKDRYNTLGQKINLDTNALI